MGALQPGLPSLAMLPQKWPLLIIDLKDCFVTIPKASFNQFEAARMAHRQFHQNAKGLRRQFSLLVYEAQGIVKACPQCSHH
ncbi:POK19 protein, partial [Anthoscopus minutus]|nr:POK19 protein [Anthoscopus minutus]